jgi:hypothetical protein
MVPGVGSTGLNSFTIGSDGGGSERAAAEEGCMLVGPMVGLGSVVVGSGVSATNQVSKSYGSAWWPTKLLSGPNDSIWVSSLVRNSLTQPGALGGTGGFIESVIQYGGDGVASLGAGLDARNILVAQSDSSATLANITSATIEGVLLSDLSFLPAYQLSNTILTILNPRDDYTGAELFDLLTFKTGTGYVYYTWNPTFVERDELGLEGDPIQGLTVRWFDKNALTGEAENAASPLVTDANGQLNAGAGIDFIRWQSLYAGSPFFTQFDVPYTQRIIVEGSNYRAQNYYTVMSQKLVYRHPVDVQQTDFEGEINR